jgi:hypothetical protein
MFQTFSLWNKQSVLKSLPFNPAKIFHGTGTPNHWWEHQRNLFESSVQTPCQCSPNSPLKLKLGTRTKRCHYTTKTKKHIYLVSCISCFWRGDGWISISSAHTKWVSSILCFYLKTVFFLKEFIINSFTGQAFMYRTSTYMNISCCYVNHTFFLPIWKLFFPPFFCSGLSQNFKCQGNLFALEGFPVIVW